MSRLPSGPEVQQAGEDFYRMLSNGVSGVDYKRNSVVFILDQSTASLNVVRQRGQNGIYPIINFLEAVAMNTGGATDFNTVTHVANIIERNCKPAGVQA